MSVWSFITMFFTFIRELLFDSKEEMDYSSSKFNARKAAVFLIIIALFLATALSVSRLVNQSIYVVKLKDAIINREEYYRRQIRKNKRELDILKQYVDDLPDKVKKSYPVPSDSGNAVENTEVSQEVQPLVAKPKPKEPTSGMTKEERKIFFDEIVKSDK